MILGITSTGMTYGNNTNRILNKIMISRQKRNLSNKFSFHIPSVCIKALIRTAFEVILLLLLSLLILDDKITR